jgi:hypothetical protein
MNRQTGRSHLTAFVSRDDGHSWEGELLLDERKTVSYPDGTQSPDGVIRIIYDWNRADEKHILMATFTEADVLAGTDVSGQVRKRVLVNRATGVNPKPWLNDDRPLKLKANADAAPLLTAAGALITPGEGDMRPVGIGHTIFSNRGYTFTDKFPQELRAKRFLFGSIDRIDAVCAEAGTVFVLTPPVERNRDSLEPDLLKQGFVKAAIPEFVLFGMPPDGRLSSSNVCAVYQRNVSKGDPLKFGKWGVLLTD